MVALAFVAAFVAWLLVRSSGSDKPTAATSSQTLATVPRREIVVRATVKSLRKLAAVTDRPIYWLGERPGTTYELTQAPDGKIYIRYLPPGVDIGDRSGQYPLVGTYPVQDAYKAVQTAGKQSGGETFKIGGEGLAVVNKAARTNVYFAYRGSSVQVEVYDPNPGRARRLVKTGGVRPIH